MNVFEKQDLIAEVLVYGIATIAAGFLIHIGWTLFELILKLF